MLRSAKQWRHDGKAIANRRTVAKEEIVIKKQAMQLPKIVPADLRKERLDIHRDGRS